MGLGTSLILMAVGAVLKWAVTATVAGVNLQTVGLILLIIGFIGFVISLIWMASAADRTAGRAPVANPDRDVQYRDPSAPTRY